MPNPAGLADGDSDDAPVVDCVEPLPLLLPLLCDTGCSLPLSTIAAGTSGAATMAGVGLFVSERRCS